MDCNPPGSSVHGILQARIREWLPCLPPGDLPYPGIKPVSPALQADSLPSEPPGQAWSGQMWIAMPPPGDLPNPGIEPMSLMSPALAGRFFTTHATWEAPGERFLPDPWEKDFVADA